MGHLLTMHFFQSTFSVFRGSRLVGAHPGMEVRRTGEEAVVGEADNLLLFREGDFVPVEVKRSFNGVVPAEIGKLNDLAARLRAPWSAIAVCQYGREAPESFTQLENRGEGVDPFRLILSYDRLLEPNPHWALGDDPFAWRPLSDEEIEAREQRLVERLTQGDEDESTDWLDYTMLRRPGTTSE